MRLAILGLILILYAMFLTPAYFEPVDLVLSTAYITTFTLMGIPLWILALWILSGYIALIIGSMLLASLVFRVPHPLVILGVTVFIGGLLTYYLFAIAL